MDWEAAADQIMDFVEDLRMRWDLSIGDAIEAISDVRTSLIIESEDTD